MLLENILKAVYGREVRQSIHDSIEQCYSDVSAAKTVADDSVVTMNQRLSQVDEALADTQSATSNANAAATTATAATGTANTAAVRCNEAVDALPFQITNLFASLGITVVDGKLCVEVERN